MAVTYDVPAGSMLSIEGPATVTIKGTFLHPSIHEQEVEPPAKTTAHRHDEPDKRKR